MAIGDGNTRLTLTNHAAFMVAAALVIVSICGIAAGQSSRVAADEGKNEIAKRVKQYPDSPISFDNYEGVPLFVQEAKVKEIGNAEYYQLTGFTTDSPKYISFPKVTLTNNTDQRVIGLALAVGNRQTRRIDGVKLSKISIESHGSYLVKPTDFIRPERTVRVTKSGKTIERLNPGLNSDKMWLRGSAGDMILIVGVVEFEDGTRWVMDRSKDPW